ncbi:MAG: serine hydrolase [Microgenomates group bacterium]
MIAQTRTVVAVGLPVVALASVVMSLASYTVVVPPQLPQTIAVSQTNIHPIPISKNEYQKLVDQKESSKTAFAPLLSQTFLAPKAIPIDESMLKNETGTELITLTSVQNQPLISAQAALVIDELSGTILYDRNSDATLAPASTTKLMTALVGLDLYKLSDVLTVSDLQGLDGARIGLFKGEQITVDQLLMALLIQSGNDAAMVLARSHPEGEVGFVRDMNNKALALGLYSTHFANPMGYDDPNQYSTARDLAILGREVMKNQLLRTIVSKPSATIADVTGKFSHKITSTNILLQDSTVVGIKTGTTTEAGQVLITQREANGKSILTVLMASQDRYADAKILQEWVQNEIQWISLEELTELTSNAQ